MCWSCVARGSSHYCPIKFNQQVAFISRGWLQRCVATCLMPSYSSRARGSWTSAMLITADWGPSHHIKSSVVHMFSASSFIGQRPMLMMLNIRHTPPFVDTTQGIAWMDKTRLCNQPLRCAEDHPSMPFWCSTSGSCGFRISCSLYRDLCLIVILLLQNQALCNMNSLGRPASLFSQFWPPWAWVWHIACGGQELSQCLQVWML